MSQPHPIQRRPSRRGAVLIVAMVTVAVVTVLLVTTTRLVLSHRRATETARWRIQADWLAESALDRAAAALADDGGYSGETWTLPAEQLDGRHGGRVVIEVKPISKTPPRWTLRSRALFPDAPDHRAQCTRQRNVSAALFPNDQGELP